MGGDGVMGRDAGKMRSHEITNDLKKTGKKALFNLVGSKEPMVISGHSVFRERVPNI